MLDLSYINLSIYLLHNYILRKILRKTEINIYIIKYFKNVFIDTAFLELSISHKWELEELIWEAL